LANSHPFLRYASVEWIAHATSFREGTTKTWHLWNTMVIDGHDIAQKPWKDGLHDKAVWTWAFQARHHALIRLLLKSKAASIPVDLFYLYVSELGKEDLLSLTSTLLEFSWPQEVLDGTLQIASERGNLNAVERLLAAGADINILVERDRQTALEAAAEGGYLNVVERLLAVGADVNAPAEWNGLTALQAAAEGGHLNVVERLLAAGADVNAPASDRGRTALQAAAEGGHLNVVERLTSAGAHEVV